MDDKLSSTDQFKDQLNKFLRTDKKEIIKSLLDSNLQEEVVQVFQQE